MSKLKAAAMVCWYAILLPFAIVWEIVRDLLIRKRNRHTPKIDGHVSAYDKPAERLKEAARMGGHDMPQRISWMPGEKRVDWDEIAGVDVTADGKPIKQVSQFPYAWRGSAKR